MTFSKNHKRISETMEPLEALIQERKEALQARDKAVEQERQVYKRLCIPYISKYFGLFLVLLLSLSLAFFVGFLTGRATIEYDIMDCHKQPNVPLQKTVFTCTLPKTGASLP